MFITPMVHHQSDFWPLEHKVNFDPLLKLIFVHPNVSIVDVQVDLYSDFKEWQALRDNNKWRPALRAVGGDFTPSGEQLGATYFLTNGWRIYLDHAVEFVGNLYTDDWPSPFLNAPGVEIASSTVSTLVEKPADVAPEVAAAVRVELAPELALLDAAMSSRASEASVTALAVALSQQPQNVWEHLVNTTYPDGSAGERIQQLLSTGNFLALK
jgi:hypothetical protein